ncbi:MAG: hypothetical protein O3A46_13925 [Candidatus Poribacteria bacterium]|nr:hypothetical protein [Candidatus Poribacteria bacterium]
MTESTTTNQKVQRVVQTVTTREERRKMWREALTRLDKLRREIAEEHGPFEDSVKVLAMTRERDDGR